MFFPIFLCDSQRRCIWLADKRKQRGPSPSHIDYWKTPFPALFSRGNFVWMFSVWSLIKEIDPSNVVILEMKLIVARLKTPRSDWNTHSVLCPNSFIESTILGLRNRAQALIDPSSKVFIHIEEVTYSYSVLIKTKFITSHDSFLITSHRNGALNIKTAFFFPKSRQVKV